MKKIIIIGVGVFAIVGIAVGATLAVTGGFSGAESSQSDEMADEKNTRKEVHYYDIHPEFIVNFSNETRPRTLMMEITVASTKNEDFDLLEKHMPELRNNLLILLADMNGVKLKSTEGKNQLREKIKSNIEKLLEKHDQKTTIEDIFLTRFVMQ